MPLSIDVIASKPHELLNECAVGVFVGKKSRGLPAWTRDLPIELRKALEVAVASDAFRGSIGQAQLLRTGAGVAILVGAGESTNGESIRRAFGALAQAASNSRLPRLAASLSFGTRDLQSTAENATVGATLGSYLFHDFRSDLSKQPMPVERLYLCEPDGKRRRVASRGLTSGAVIAEATTRVRNLVNTPANDLTPKNYAEIARQWCKNADVKLQILSPRDIARAKMGAVMAVGGGSANEPRFLIANYFGRPKQQKTIDLALIGKGVTFDTGGITLKPGLNMWEMRGDMMGSAVTLTTICAAARLGLKHNIVALMPLVENMPSANAYRPGDIVRTLSGQTIEIISTDAEGRLILADALTYAQRFNPKLMIDCATLTGAMVVALGEVACGVFATHDELWQSLEQASQKSGEKSWRMPLFEEYDKQFESPVADMRNSGGREGGACVAARILKRFTGNLPWMHVDIAGVDNYTFNHDYSPKGASGFGARLLIEFLRQPQLNKTISSVWDKAAKDKFEGQKPAKKSTAKR